MRLLLLCLALCGKLVLQAQCGPQVSADQLPAPKKNLSELLNGKMPSCFTSVKRDTAQPRIIIRCGRSTVNDKVVYVVDGVVKEASDLKTLNANDIALITILKGSEAAALYGSEATAGVVVIQTKRTAERKIVLYDEEDNSVLEGSSISLKKKSETGELILSQTNSSGASKLEVSLNEPYKVQVSMIGYKTLDTVLTFKDREKRVELKLVKQYKTNKEVVITAYSSRRIGCGGCWLSCICSGISITSADSIKKAEKSIPFQVYPNPAPAQSLIHFRVPGQGKIELWNSAGQLIYTLLVAEEVGSLKSLLLPRVSAGTYFARYAASTGSKAQTYPFIIQ
jgi:TonB-dependent SusC/RagA subfamily outer membrane receptor